MQILHQPPNNGEIPAVIFEASIYPFITCKIRWTVILHNLIFGDPSTKKMILKFENKGGIQSIPKNLVILSEFNQMT